MQMREFDEKLSSRCQSVALDRTGASKQVVVTRLKK